MRPWIFAAGLAGVLWSGCETGKHDSEAKEQISAAMTDQMAIDSSMMSSASAPRTAAVPVQKPVPKPSPAPIPVQPQAPDGSSPRRPALPTPTSVANPLLFSETWYRWTPDGCVELLGFTDAAGIPEAATFSTHCKLSNGGFARELYGGNMAADSTTITVDPEVRFCEGLPSARFQAGYAIVTDEQLLISAPADVPMNGAFTNSKYNDGRTDLPFPMNGSPTDGCFTPSGFVPGNAIGL